MAEEWKQPFVLNTKLIAAIIHQETSLMQAFRELDLGTQIL